jgi:lipopolysaccharide transport system ATP-binding protein
MESCPNTNPTTMYDVNRTPGETLIMAEGVSKKFCRDSRRAQWYGLADSYGPRLHRNRLRSGEFWSVRDLSLNIRRGECLGLLGHNGAGKSTLLKLLTGLIRPDTGYVRMDGRVSALIELGTGFNPVLTGRENIYNNGALLGLSKREIDKKFEDIVDFSGLSDVIDTPVQFYSSGMKVRLGFSVATQMESDIMLIDEVLSVGDMNFVLKCFNRMDELLPRTAVILVSHSIPNIARAATSVGIMDAGRLIHIGTDVPEGLNRYYELYKPQTTVFQAGPEAALLSTTFCDEDGRALMETDMPRINHGSPFSIRFEIRATIDLKDCGCYLAFHDNSSRNFAEVLNGNDPAATVDMRSGESKIFTAHFEHNPFAQGVFSVTIGFYASTRKIRKMIFRMPSTCHFRVSSHHHGWAPVSLDPIWQTDAATTPQ